MSVVRIGYVPLTDAAIVIAAAELGFAEREGIAIELQREASWATLRDRLALGVIDAAHILAPLAIGMTLGLGPGPATPLVAPFQLNLNGNAVTLSRALWEELDVAENAGPPAVASALGEAVRRRQRSGNPPLTLATVFPYSTHTFLLHAFLRLGGVEPDRDVRITVVPPPRASEALRSGAIDGFCVGAPWNSVAAADGSGRIVAFGSELIPDAPEKVLAWPAGRIDRETGLRLVRALCRAGEWCADRDNRAELARLLGEPRHLSVDPEVVRRSLDGVLLLGRFGPVRSDPAYLKLGPDTHRPDLRAPAWIHGELVAAGLADGAARELEAATAIYRPDLFDAAVGVPRLSVHE